MRRARVTPPGRARQRGGRFIWARSLYALGACGQAVNRGERTLFPGHAAGPASPAPQFCLAATFPERRRRPVPATNSPSGDSVSTGLAGARHELVDRASRGSADRTALECYADRVDTLLQRLYFQAPSAAQATAIVALGGYGRRHLTLHSDVDVLVLFEHPLGADDERFLRGFLNPLWDLPLTVGHQVRELGDFAQLETDNPEFLLALLDARRVVGDPGLYSRFLAAFHRPESHAAILELLKTLIDERHGKFNDTLYQLEPDTKDSPGALRDLLAVRTIARLTDPALLGHGPADPARLDEAEDFLFRIRSIVHLERNRNQNILTHELQEKAALLLGYPGGQPQQRVERLMGDYFRHARIVSRSLEWARKSAPRPVGANMVRSRDGVRFVDGERAAREPHTWLPLFQAALDQDTVVADEALALIQQHVDRYAPEDFFPTTVERDGLLAFLKPRPGLYARLSEMHDRGLLGRMFPEFQSIFSRVVRDFYHKYTVDEHTLLTIRNLESLTAPATPSRYRFSGLLADLAAPEHLVLALLYHDVGKWTDAEDHASESVRMARRMFDRLGLEPDARAMIEFLIEKHLRMSIVAFRRDTEDPDIVRDFAGVVGIEERLKMLCLLTFADVSAVSTETLTPWREELLWRLYVDTYNHLTIGYGDDRIVHDQSAVVELMRGRPDDVTEDEIFRFLEGLPCRYLQLFDPAAIYGHVQLSRNIKPDQVHATTQRKGTAWELTVVTLDKPFLFSNICGVLASLGMDILRGHAMTNPNGLVLDIFQFTDEERFLELNPDGRARLIQTLQEAVSGRTDVTARLRARASSVLHRGTVRRFEPVIHADNQSSQRYSILDIIASNEIGLLHRISRVISRHGCNVDLVLISTEGAKAIDVFHINAAGEKLSDAAQAELTADLQRTLEGHDEAD
jgi:[protein-PII] uridylyltransferase